MDLNAYFARINYTGSTAVNNETLRHLHRAHMLTVPFENLDIHLNRPIVLNNVDLLYEKIVNQRRGGFCYEQNGLFGEILCEMGFNVTLMEARVSCGDGNFGRRFDHLALLVDMEERWLVDVGFGEGFTEALRLDTPEPQAQYGKNYRVIHDNERGVYAQQTDDRSWQDEYEFYFTPRQLIDFTPGCTYHQTSPNSSFTKKRVCSLATENGRKTISADRFIVTVNGLRTEQPITNETEYYGLLEVHFGIKLGHD